LPGLTVANPQAGWGFRRGACGLHARRCGRSDGRPLARQAARQQLVCANRRSGSWHPVRTEGLFVVKFELQAAQQVLPLQPLHLAAGGQEGR